MNHIVTQQQIADLINASNGTFISVDFIKRTTGELRSITCRTGVHAYETGAGAKYDAQAKGLIPVWEANAAGGKDAYRCISVAGIMSARLGGHSYEVQV